MRAAIGKIFERKPRTAALEQGLRDENPEPHMVCHAGARRKIGLAEAPEQVERKPRSVIADLDRDGRRIPESGDVDLARGELDSILNEVGEPVHDLGAASNQRLFTRGLAGRREDQPHPLITVG